MASTDNCVVITGMGWITPLGFDVDSVWTKLLSGASAAGPVTRFDAGTLSTNFGCQIPASFELFDFMDEASNNHATAGLSTKFALAAAAQAWVNAGLGDRTGARNPALRDHVDPDRFGVYLGAGEGPLDYENFFGSNLAGWDASEDGEGPARTVNKRVWGEHAMKTMSAIAELEQEPNASVSHIATAFNCYGPAANCMTACAASTQAIGEAAEIIKRGDADLMFAGGAHSMLHILGMTGFIRLTAMSTRRDTPKTASRPFDQTREGFVMGEGAGVVILESLESAKRRGATPLAEVAGYGSSADAYRITDIQPEGLGAVKAMRRALEQAGIDPTHPDGAGRPPVQYVSAHGTGTPENDGIESQAVRTTFADQAERVPFASLKSMTGHLIQAAGAVELIACVQAIKTGFIPPTINYESPDPRCSLDHVPNEARDTQGRIDVCLSNSFGFGGQNDSVCIRRFTE